MNPEVDVLSPLPEESAPLPWQRGWRTFKSVWPQLLYISAATIAIPQYLLYWNQSLAAAAFSRQMGLNQTEVAPLALPTLLERLKDFSVHYGLLALLATLIAILGYFSIIALTLQNQRGHPPDTLEAIRSGIKVFFPRHLLNLPLLLLAGTTAALTVFAAPSLGLLGQYLAITLMVLLAALPTLLSMTPSTPLRALRSALRMDYVRESGVSRWSAFFVLLTYQMGLIGVMTLLKHGQDQLLLLDIGVQVKRSLWFKVSSWWPFGMVTLVIEGLSSLLLGIILGAFALFTSCFIFELSQKKTKTRV